jgi:hypothetical protein
MAASTGILWLVLVNVVICGGLVVRHIVISQYKSDRRTANDVAEEMGRCALIFFISLT